MAAISWTINHYDLDGNFVATLDECTDKHMKFALNGLDEASFTMYLDDAKASAIGNLTSVIKIWRTVNDTIYGSSYTSVNPEFVGLVTSTVKDGEQNTMQVQCYSPMWRLQSRFHRNNHYHVIDPDTGSAWKQGRLMWYHIELINNVFSTGENAHTGIRQGTFAATDPTMAPFFTPKGSNVWSVIFDQLLPRAGSPDIRIDYTHIEGSGIDLCKFNTVEHLGNDISGATRFQYHTGAFNVNDVTEQVLVAPGQFGNYMWAVGQGGPNSGKVGLARQASGQWGYETIGAYMVYEDTELQKLAAVQAYVEDRFDLVNTPQASYSVVLSPAVPPYYRSEYNLGDVVGIDASKGALQVSGVSQRIYEIDLRMSDNNFETAQVLLADDFHGKVTGT